MDKSYTAQYNGSSDTYLSIRVYTTETSVAGCWSKERVIVRFIHNSSSWNSDALTATLKFNGVTKTVRFSYSGKDNILLFDFTQQTSHDNTTGKKTVNLNISDNRDNSPYTTTVSFNQNIVLDTIPRYANIKTASVEWTTLNRAKVNFSTDVTCNDWQWKWTEEADSKYRSFSSSTTFTATALGSHGPGSTKSLTFRVKHAQSGLWKTKSLNITFKKLPTLTVDSGTYIGDKITYKVNNKIATTTLYYEHKKADNTYVRISNLSVDGTSHTPSQTEKDTMYKIIPNSASLGIQFCVKVVESNGREYYSVPDSHKKLVKAKPSECKPVFTNFTYKDILAASTQATGNNQKIIQDVSEVEVDVTDHQATAKLYATIKSYTVTNQNTTLTLVNNKQIIKKPQANTLTVTVKDSRGFTTAVTKEVIWVPYSKPYFTGSTAISRKNAIETSMLLTLFGKYHAVDFGSQSNEITKAEYRRKLLNSSTWEDWVNCTTAVTGFDGNFSPTTMNAISGFELGKGYNVEVRVYDRFHPTVVKAMILSSGDIMLYHDGQRTGVNCIPWNTIKGSYLDTLFSKDIKPKILGNTEHLDDLKYESMVYGQPAISNTSTSRGYPVASAGQLFVIWNGNYTTQIYFTYNSMNWYIREWQSWNNNWLSWRIFKWDETRISNIESNKIDRNELKTTLLNQFYPIGTIYETTSSALDTVAKMNTHFGGSWEIYGAGRVTVGKDSGTFSTIGGTGGVEKYALKISEMPSHRHTQASHSHTGKIKPTDGHVSGSTNELRRWSDSSTGVTTGQTTNSVTPTINLTGGGGAHTNLQPYIVVYRYRRIA